MGALDRVFRGRRGAFSQRPLAAQVAALFANGEQGLWYDVESFRDAWNNVGPERLTNGAFDADSSWAKGAGWSISGGVASFAATGATSNLIQEGAVIVGRWYQVSVTLVTRTTGQARVLVGNSSPTPWYSAAGTYTALVTAVGSQQVIIQADASFAGSIDNISVKEWLGASACSLYQDAAGTLPAYLPGQGQVDPPIGLVLDRRKGFALGPELIANGDFAADTWWSKDTGVTISGGVCIFSAVTTSRGVYRSNLVQSGRYYAITYTITVNSGSIRPLASGSFGVNRTFSGTFTEVLGGTSGTLLGFFANPSFDGTIDNVSVREIQGNHSYQTTTASRPTLSARYNLLIKSEQFSDAQWSKNRCGITANAAIAPDGTFTASKLVEDVSASTTHTLQGQIITLQAVPHVCTVYLKAGERSWALVRVGASGGNFSQYFDLANGLKGNAGAGLTSATILSVGGGWYKCQLVGLPAAANDYALSVFSATGNGGVAYTGDGVSGIYIWGVDFRLANDGIGLPDYQRVVDANTYDTSGFPLFLKFDGIDDGIQTASLDFTSSDKVFCCASFRKLTDAATGSLFELSATIASNPGSFYITAPGAGNSGNIKLATKGTTEVNVATSAAGYPSPVSAIASAVMDIAAPISTLRVNGVVAQSSSASLGSGSLGNYPLYIGRRAGSSLPFNGRLYGLLIRGGASSDGQIAKVEKLMNQKARIY